MFVNSPFASTTAGQIWMTWQITIALAVIQSVQLECFVYRMPERFGKKAPRTALFLIFLAANIAVELSHLTILPRCAVLIALFYAYVMTVKKLPWTNAMLLSESIILMTEFALLLTRDGLLLKSLGISVASSSAAGTLIVAAAYLALATALVFSLRSFFDVYAEVTVTPLQFIIQTAPMLTYFAVRYLYFTIFDREPIDETLLSGLQYAQLLAAGCAVAVQSLLAANIQAHEKIRENLKTQYMLEKQQQQYLVKTESIEAVNRKYHDLKHIITGIRAMNTEDAIAIAEELENETRAYEQVQETGNYVISVLLSEKLRECREKSIRLIPYIDAAGLSFVSNSDLCTIFGNAMDNAIEASMRIEPQKREIYVKIRRSDDMMLISVQNCFNGELRSADGRLLSVKADAEEHGYGTENIRRTAEKYGGTSAFSAEDDLFTLNVLLPIPQENR